MVLEPVRGELAEPAFEALGDPRMWAFFPHLQPASVEDLKARFMRWNLGPPSNNPLFTGWENWLGIERETRAVTGLFQATIMRGESALIAYSVAPARWRQGYAREAVEAIVDHLADAHEIAHVFADIDKRNTASIAFVRALGFSQISSGDEPRFALRTFRAG